MNFDTTITLGIGGRYITFTPIEISMNKNWGTTFNLLRFNTRWNEKAWIDSVFALFSYTHTEYLQQLEILGISIFTKFKE